MKKTKAAKILICLGILLTALNCPATLFAAGKSAKWAPTTTIAYYTENGKWHENYREIVTYNAKSQMTSLKYLGDVEALYKYTYNKNGNIKKSCYYVNGSLASTTEYYYYTKGKEKGFLRKTVEKYADQKSSDQSAVTKYSYTLKNKRIVKEIRKSAGYTETIIYGNSGMVSTSTKKYKDGYSITDTYNSKGKLIKNVSGNSEDGYAVSTYYYKKGMLNRIVVKQPKGSDQDDYTITYKYKTDKSGNIKERVELTDGKESEKLVYKAYKKV